MGWTGTYNYSTNPKGKDRIYAAIIQEGYSFEEHNGGFWRKSEVIDSALVGNTVYLAVHYTSNAGIDETYAAVILTAYRDGEFLTKGMDEGLGPGEANCPKRILDKLSPTDHEYALDWRKRCEENRKARNADQLAKLPLGAKVKRNDGVILEAYKLRKRKVYVDWKTRHYMTAKQLRKTGYEIL